ncbi:MAG: hypothetical protein C4519_00380 [Desulfobacteraceae bacterium]|nr:MAG: hypothetical protein C4519_00380 [Desulfobacteraceae bacterium]
MTHECRQPCPYESDIKDIKADTSEILKVLNGVNGDKGIKTRLAVMEAWMVEQKNSRDRWARALTVAAVGFGVTVIVAVFIAAASGIIKL